MKINDAQEEDYDIVKITHIGFVDEYGIEGLLLLKADDGKEFHMHAFSGEVARHISEFYSGKESVPTIYKMLEEICEVNEIWVLMFYGEDHPEKQFITLNDAVKWVVNRMVETEKNTKFLSAYWSKLKYQDENDQINWDESVYDFLKGVNKQ